ncbi:hypothetical protein GPL15_01985 [Clostridium sp. MCC353]|uniref:bifunctional adenosylcobinamide kinase/adenosylcobinamide-phosphate guanylyltransferase n=1 Tax=Clostridium sp. MCC353 TaxID=2592646 RepID=UPI001C00A1C3|nr:bifunctional adenosylcobinamide kinase/adenosylcobinamide-phosphate guanylyltransferase [Clostridium sp. MCC353]MBT9775278.1 hypothetical protein [Clostridium sp. MCC353]
MLYLVTGPEKSGKSAKAEALAVRLGENRIYLATMVPFGEEGRKRVEHHRELRKEKGFNTVECPVDIDQADIPKNAVVLLECILNLAANICFGTEGCPPHTAEETVRLVCEKVDRLNKKCRELIVVTGQMEYDQGYDEETRAYIEAVHQINRRLEQMADQVIGGGEKEYPRFPLFVDLNKKRVVVAGAGKIGTRRAAVLAEFGAAVLVAAPEGCEEMARLEQAGLVHWERRPVREADLNGAYLAVAATNNPDVNDRMAKLCRERGIMVSHAGDQSQCSFYFPGIAREGELVAGIVADGKSHSLAKQAAQSLRIWLRQFMTERNGER